MRREYLQKDLIGEKKMLSTVIWPVFKSFEGLTLEYELISTTGVKFFVDVFYEPLGLAFESEGFVSHAENITRERFTFERMRIRTLALYGYKYIPFSWDELDKKPDACRRSVYELIGRYNADHTELSVLEREVLRYVRGLNRPFRVADVCSCLQLWQQASRKIIAKLLEKQLIRHLVTGKKRVHQYVLEERALSLLY